MSGAAARTGNLNEIYKVNNIKEGGGWYKYETPLYENRSEED